MTIRQSFCINKNPPHKEGMPSELIKPCIIGDIDNNELVQNSHKSGGTIVKMDNHIELQQDTISIWVWNDERGSDYRDSYEVTKEYSFFEILDNGYCLSKQSDIKKTGKI